MSTSFLRQRSFYAAADRIIFDIGSLYIKCGFSNEPSPRFVIPNAIPIPYTDSREGCSMGRKVVPLWDVSVTESDLVRLRKLLPTILRHIYHQCLLVDSKQRKVVLCEDPLLPPRVKTIIADVFFTVFKVPHLTFISAPLASLAVLGKTSGLVVNCGFLETTVLPVYDGRPLTSNVTIIRVAGQAINHRLQELVGRYGSYQSLDQANPVCPVPHHIISTLDLGAWEQMKTQLLFIGNRPTTTEHIGPAAASSEQLPSTSYETRYESNAASLSFPLPNHQGSIILPGWIRERAAEVLYEGDEDDRSIASIAAEAVAQCPTDVRADIMQNILICGGTGMMPGFLVRYQDELMHAIEERPRYQKLKRLAAKVKLAHPVFASSCMAWIGASLLIPLSVHSYEITKEEFQSGKPLSDWTRITTSCA
ncbi:actin family [Phlyctochytrium arcticum]|nr:actin family [Phlyctochytrium arcticum]KAI9095246.1 actin family [Phlyctochytrium arcticum]